MTGCYLSRNWHQKNHPTPAQLFSPGKRGHGPKLSISHKSSREYVVRPHSLPLKFFFFLILTMDKSDPSLVPTDPEKGSSTAETPSVTGETEPTIEKAFLTGLKLYLTLSSIIIVGFLITLDGSIVVTVRGFFLFCHFTEETLTNEQGDPENHGTFRLNCRYWVVWQCLHDFKVRVCPLKASLGCFSNLD